MLRDGCSPEVSETSDLIVKKGSGRLTKAQINHDCFQAFALSPKKSATLSDRAFKFQSVLNDY